MQKTTIQKNLSSFRNGIIILLIGIVGMTLIFSEGIYESELIILNPEKSTTFEISLNGHGIAFYEINIHNYQQTPLFAQILDPLGNIIAEQKIHTILSENFFDFNTDGNYIIRITNISEKNLEFNIKYGDTKIEELRIPELITFIGSSILIYGIFRKMKNYSIAHP
ncbi:MAG: hypothetical protein ACE5EJ_05570 [Nitrosopumilaceae archaeon]